MAINNKPSVPAPAIFSSDPLEQIAMRGVQDRGMSGLNYMFLNAFGDRRRMDQEAYMAGVNRANDQSVMLGQKELEQAQHEAMLKAAVKLVEEGGDPSTMPGLSQVFGPNKPNAMKGDLMRSQIHKNMQEGKGSGEQLKVRADIGPAGTGFYTVEGKGGNALDRVRAEEKRLLIERGQIDPTTGKRIGTPVDETEARRKYRSQNQ
jgi:hypothetical protein